MRTIVEIVLGAVVFVETLALLLRKARHLRISIDFDRKNEGDPDDPAPSEQR